MTALELTTEYMRIFFSSENLDELKNLFTDHLQFDGPFHSFTSAEAYIQSLKSDPPKGMCYKLLNTYEGQQSVCLIYEFKKGNISTPMAQTFHTNGGKIDKIMLIFDSSAFSLTKD